MTVTGKLTNANGCTVFLILSKSGIPVGTLKTFNSSFAETYSVDPGKYTLVIEGETTGILTVSVTGDNIVVKPDSTQEFSGDIMGRFIIAVPA